MQFFNHTINEDSNGFKCVWTSYVGDDEESIAMWEELLVSSAQRSSSSTLPEEADNIREVPERGPTYIGIDQDAKPKARASIMERARKRHSAYLQQQQMSSPSQLRQLKIRQSMVSALLPLQNIRVEAAHPATLRVIVSMTRD